MIRTFEFVFCEFTKLTPKKWILRPKSNIVSGWKYMICKFSTTVSSTFSMKCLKLIKSSIFWVPKQLTQSFLSTQLMSSLIKSHQSTSKLWTNYNHEQSRDQGEKNQVRRLSWALKLSVSSGSDNAYSKKKKLILN